MCHTISLLKFLKVIVDKQQQKYVPASSMWLIRVFSDLAHTDEQHYLKIDCSGVNKSSPSWYRAQAYDPEKQVCYFNKPRDDELYNVFISNRIKTENFNNSIYFKINRVQGEGKIFDAEKTLKQDVAHDRFSKFDTDSEQPEFNERGRKRGNEETSEQPIRRNRINKKSARSIFFQDDNNVQTETKTTTKCSNTKLKTRNFLANVS